MTDKIPRQNKKEQDPQVRNSNFEEVSFNYTEEQALLEASRCLQCKKPPCVPGCPVAINIPAFIKKITEKDYLGAYNVILKDNFFPAVCGRVCPQEVQCEGSCILNKKGTPIAIGNLERFVADWVRENAPNPRPLSPPAGQGEKKRVAVVGSGPSGLACAGELNARGYDVTVFEALHELGGVLIYGIPEFRLPKDIVKHEIDGLKKAGIKFDVNQIVGRLKTIKELKTEHGFDAVFIGSGAGFPSFMNIPGEDLNGVYSSNEYLTRVNLMKAYKDDVDTPIKKGKNVAVVGGGNTAMDAARSAKRLGAEHVYLIYRRSRAEMPARNEEIHHAEEEGIEFFLLNNPVAYLGDDKGFVNKVRVQKMELGEPDESGRRRPVPIKDSEYELEIDVAIVAIGTKSNPIIKDTTPGLAVNKWGYIETDVDGKTSIDGVYAGGDIVTGAATVILAMGAGKQAAQAIADYLG